MKDVEIPMNAVYFVIKNGNYELIHLFESKMNVVFKFDSLRSSIKSWNFEMTEYALNNHDNYEFLQKNDLNNENNIIVNANVLVLLNNLNSNFVFLDSVLIPFLRNNPEFINDKNIYNIIHATLGDMTCFLAKEFFQYPNLNVNYYSNEFNSNFIGQAIQVDNSNAVEFFK